MEQTRRGGGGKGGGNRVEGSGRGSEEKQCSLSTFSLAEDALKRQCSFSPLGKPSFKKCGLNLYNVQKTPLNFGYQQGKFDLCFRLKTSLHIHFKKR